MEEIKTAIQSGNEKSIDEEIGDLLFAVVNLSRFRKRTPAEELLAQSTKKFQKRFEYIEAQLKKQGTTPEESSLEEMEVLWNKAKKEE